MQFSRHHGHHTSTGIMGMTGWMCRCVGRSGPPILPEMAGLPDFSLRSCMRGAAVALEWVRGRGAFCTPGQVVRLALASGNIVEAGQRQQQVMLGGRQSRRLRHGVRW